MSEASQVVLAGGSCNCAGGACAVPEVVLSAADLHAPEPEGRAVGGSAKTSAGDVFCVEMIQMNLSVERLFAPGETRCKKRDPRKLEELVASMRTLGVLEPLIVVEEPGRGQFRVLAGEGRLEAAVAAGLPVVPCRVVQGPLNEAVECWIMHNENHCREDLSPLDLARLYRKILDGTGWTQERVAALMGTSQGNVSECLKLLSLPDEIQRLVAEGKLSAKGALRGRKAAGKGVGVAKPAEGRVLEEYGCDNGDLGVRLLVLATRGKTPPLDNVIYVLERHLQFLRCKQKNEVG